MERNRTGAAGKPAGFTLIELMITIAVVAILVAIAVTSYGFATVKTHRSAAKACLVEGAQYMERYYALHFSYEDATLPACSADVGDFYTIGFDGTPDADSYKIKAVPTARQDDSRCGTLTLDATGAKGATDVDACW